jgi:hypothetical protein
MEAGGIFCLVRQNVFLDVKRVIRHRKCGREKIIGGLAQLVERFPYKEDVGGSNPSAPTSLLRT